MVIKTPNDSLRNDPEYSNYIQRFINEGKRLEQLSQTQHPNIVRIRDLFHEGGTYCLVMDFVQGESLFSLVQKRGALPVEEALKYIIQIGDALQVVHQGGLVHRDAHPGNMMIQQDGKAILIDFGIAGETMPTTVSSKIFGNPGFAPCEQMRGDREPYVDVYSLAASLYYAVTGKRPVESFNRKAYNVPLISPQKHNPTISNELNQAILKGMEVEPEDRPQKMQDLLSMLVILVEEEEEEHKLLTFWSQGKKLHDGKYEIEKYIAQGGFGITYLAKDENKGRVVIKSLNQNRQKRREFEKLQKDFLNEALNLARCNHPHVVRVREVFQEGKLWCMAMEYIEGENLNQLVSRRGILPEAEAVEYIRQIGEALTVVHRNGLLHRDVKPANILIRARKPEAVLIDFGIAREFIPSKTQLHTPYRSNGFAPIEQYEESAKRGAYTDVYALAATLYFLVTGESPQQSIIRAEIKAQKIAVKSESPISMNPHLSVRVNDVILKGMEVQAKDRPQTVQEWLSMLLEEEEEAVTIWKKGQELQSGKYRIEKDIAQGGFGITYLAKDENNRRVVIKSLNETVQKRPDFAKLQQDFLNEAVKLAKCNHPHVVKVREVFQEGKLWCMAMEYIEGEHLADRVVNGGVLSEAEAVGYIRQIGEALTVVHNNGLLHRDVKPANILIRARKPEAVLIDFGIAREFTPSETRLHTPYLSHCFAPIEQYETVAKRGAYTDVYALAATLYFLVTKNLPEPAISRVSGVVVKSPKSLNPILSVRVNDAILKGMEVEAQKRPQTMGEWLELLKEPPQKPITKTSIPPKSNPPKSNPPKSHPPKSNPPKSHPVTGRKNQPTNQPTLINPSRRKFIQRLGWVGAGLGVTAFVGKLFTDAASNNPSVPQELSLQSFDFETVTVDAKGTINNRRNLQAKYYAEDLENGVTLEMVEIPGGTFTMGSPPGEEQRRDNEGPQREVTVPGF